MIDEFQFQFPVTKFRPPGSQDTIDRIALVRQIQAAVQNQRLTLISAPAGSGKTTLAADFTRSTPAFNSRWLSLDEDDNNSSTFLLALLLASDLPLEAELFEMVNQEQLLPRQVANVLINQLDALAGQSLVFIFDDLHLLTNEAIHEFLDYFIERMPDHVRILATTRYDLPLALARLRTRSELAELRLESLRFSRDEVNGLLNHLLQLDIADHLIDQMMERTEGWIAGLRLVALSLAEIDADQRSQYIRGLAHDNRYVFDLLAAEVLAQQPTEIRDFLLDTAILDELSSDLCAAVTQQPVVDVILRDLHRRNLFLVSLGGSTYRYHALFRDFLREHLKRRYPNRYRMLHKRAAVAHHAPQRKIQHYQASEAWDEAATLISTHGRRLIENGNRTIVADWLARLPTELHDRYGWLLYLKGTLAYHQGDFPTAMRLMNAAEVQFHHEGDSEGVFEAIMMYNAADEEGEDFESQMQYIQRVEPYITNDGQRLVIDLVLTWTYIYAAQRPEAAHHLIKALKLLKQAPDKLGFVGFQIAAPMLLVFDNLASLRVTIHEILQYFDLDTHVFVASCRALLGHMAIWEGDLEQAHREMDESTAIWNRLGGINDIHISVQQFSYFSLALIEGDTETINRLTGDLHTKPDGSLHLVSRRACWAWLNGNKDETHRLLKLLPPLEDVEDNRNVGVYRLSIDSLLALDAGDFEDLEPTLIHYIQRQQDRRSFYSLFAHDLRVTLIYCYLQLGLLESALSQLKSLMGAYAPLAIPGRLAQEGPIIIPLMETARSHHIQMDFAESVLALLRPAQESHPIEIEATGATLTAREAEILGLLVKGASNREIAETCFISLPTVKTHVSRILQKLDVSSRTHAVARARELRLL